MATRLWKLCQNSAISLPMAIRIIPKTKAEIAAEEGAKRAQAGRAKAPGGRPRIGEEGKTDAHRKPWIALGMSERTWYRRQAEKRQARG